MINATYIEYCETLWSEWLAGRLKLPPSVEARFQLQHAPELYLRFGKGTTPFCFLLTNPGDAMPHQHRDLVTGLTRGETIIDQRMSYWEAALALGAFYPEALRGKPAGTRIDAMAHLVKLHNTFCTARADCILQFESLPFHSSSLPGKDRIPAVVDATPLLSGYASALKGALKNVSVVALSVVDSSQSISASSVSRSNWLKWQADLLGINPTRLKLETLIEKDGKITSAFLYEKVGNCVRGIVLMMGNPIFPGSPGLDRIVKVLCRGCAGAGPE